MEVDTTVTTTLKLEKEEVQNLDYVLRTIIEQHREKELIPEKVEVFCYEMIELLSKEFR